MSDAITAHVSHRADPVPFGAIHSALDAGLVIPFLGAGASMERRESTEMWSPSPDVKTKFGPLGAELAEWLGGRVETYPAETTATDLARVAQFAESTIGRPMLRVFLDRAFEPSPTPTALHHYLASFTKPLLIITTNYDDMIEAAFEAAGRPYHLIIQTISPDRAATMRIRRAESDVIEDSDAIDIDIGSAAIIFKIHGSSGPGDIQDYLITEDDYLRFLQRMMNGAAVPTPLAVPMRTRQFLFIGYGLEDWNMRLLLHQLKEYVSAPSSVTPPSWAIMHSVDEVDRRLWRDRGVDLFEIPLADFVDGLATVRDSAE